nr:transposase [Waterburya agarophytonicola]
MIATLHKTRNHFRVINTDKANTYPKAIEELFESDLLPESVEHRAVKYLNNLIEPTFRTSKCSLKRLR